MSWQDLVLAVGGFVIAAGIIPTILSAAKPPLTTSATIFAVLGVSCVAFASLDLWLTSAGVALQFVLWGIVLAQTLALSRATRRLRAVEASLPSVTLDASGTDTSRADEAGAGAA